MKEYQQNRRARNNAQPRNNVVTGSPSPKGQEKSNPQELLAKIMKDMKPGWDSEKQEQESKSEAPLEYEDNTDLYTFPLIIKAALRIDDEQEFQEFCSTLKNENSKIFFKYRGALQEHAKDLGIE